MPDLSTESGYDRSADPAAERIVAEYRIATRGDLDRVAEVMAGEQSAGTFLRVAYESDELTARHTATVESLVEEDPEALAIGALPGSTGGTDDRVRVARVRIAYPACNFGPSLAALMTTVAGNLYELRDLAGVKLLDVEIPRAVLERYSGPRHGIAGTRRAVGNADQALIGTIIKPSIGLGRDEMRQVVRDLAAAEIDLVKDDEINADAVYFPLAERIDIVQDVLEDEIQRTGKPTMYAFNITGDLDDMKRAAEHIARRGGTCAMVAVPHTGLTALAELRRSTDLVIHGHRAGFGALDRHPLLGHSFTVFQKLARLAGVDHLHVGGVNSKFWEPNENIVDSVRALGAPLGRGEAALPAVSAAQTPATAAETRRLLGTDDLLILAGGGIHGHPGGVADGVAAMREAWAHASAGRDPVEHAPDGSALRVALETFGGR